MTLDEASPKTFRPDYEGFRGSGISVEMYRPRYALTNEEMERWNIVTGNGRPLTAAHILDKIGSTHRYVADEHETVVSMGVEAAHKALQGKNSVDFLMVSSSFPTGEDLSQKIGNELGMHLTEDEGLNIHMACSGYAAGLLYLHKNRERFEGARVLFLNSEKYHPHLADLRQPDGVKKDPSLAQSIFSDGAVASVFTFGKDIDVLGAKKITPDDLPTEVNEFIRMPIDEENITGRSLVIQIPESITGKVWQSGPDVFRTMMSVVPMLASATLEASGISEDQIKMTLVHQGSKRMTQGLEEKFAGRFGEVIHDYHEGNFSSGSIPKQIGSLLENRRINPGDNLLLAGFGGGLMGVSLVVQMG